MEELRIVEEHFVRFGITKQETLVVLAMVEVEGQLIILEEAGGGWYGGGAGPYSGGGRWFRIYWRGK